MRGASTHHSAPRHLPPSLSSLCLRFCLDGLQPLVQLLAAGTGHGEAMLNAPLQSHEALGLLLKQRFVKHARAAARGGRGAGEMACVCVRARARVCVCGGVTIRKGAKVRKTGTAQRTTSGQVLKTLAPPRHLRHHHRRHLLLLQRRTSRGKTAERAPTGGRASRT